MHWDLQHADVSHLGQINDYIADNVNKEKEESIRTRTFKDPNIQHVYNLLFEVVDNPHTVFDGE